MLPQAPTDVREYRFSTLNETIFLSALAALFTHELDAVANHEWTVMPLLDQLPDQIGMTVFVALHVPLFALIVGAVANRESRIRKLARLLICGFLLIHAGLHYWFSNAPGYEFTSLLSNVLIYGGATLGGIYMLFYWSSNRRKSRVGAR